LKINALQRMIFIIFTIHRIAINTGELLRSDMRPLSCSPRTPRAKGAKEILRDCQDQIRDV